MRTRTEVVKLLSELKLFERSRSAKEEARDLQEAEDDGQKRRRSSCKQS